jgi:hypothetical protein
MLSGRALLSYVQGCEFIPSSEKKKKKRKIKRKGKKEGK